MKRYLAILLMFIYTAFSAVMIAQYHRYCSDCTQERPISNTNIPKECNEFEVAGRHEAHSIAHPISFQKKLLSAHQHHNTYSYSVSSQTLLPLHSDPARAVPAVPVYVRHCAFLL